MQTKSTRATVAGKIAHNTMRRRCREIERKRIDDARREAETMKQRNLARYQKQEREDDSQ